ncbi:methyltransferase [uncultured Erythrobacter sp.]|uniref:methyltransferase n=1 Tax=uncultured Erythrobacter sp. TaxID=263913 RepID=UPI00261E0C59|nr:methyltransferase [uncultured Erythrobacter sp.]
MASQPLKVRWKARRNRMFASRAFQYWTARLPFSRPISRNRAGTMFDHIVGFSYSRVLLAVVESDLLQLLKDGPISAAFVAARTDLSEDAALCLLRAARALDVAEEVLPDQWMLGQQGAVLAANAGAQAMIRHHRLLYRDLAEPLELLRKDRKEATELSTYWSYAGALQGTAERGQETTEYSELMAASQHFVADEVLASFSFPKRGSLLDVGGGHGAFLKRVAEAYPDLRLGLFDLPEVVETGKTSLASAVGEERLGCHPGNFFEDSIPTGYDLVSLVRILHDHDDGPAQQLLTNIRASLTPDSRLMIAEPMAQVPGAEAMGEAFFGLYLWAMGSGRARSPKEIQLMLKTAGFSSSRLVATPQPVVASIIVAQA